jgi:hypothetical protein
MMFRPKRSGRVILCSAFALAVFINLAPRLEGAQDAAPFDYRPYATILKNHVDDEGHVDYQALKGRRQELDAFLDKVARLKEDRFKSWPKADRIAFLTNAYNALTLKAIVDHYPIKATTKEAPKNSIRQIRGVWKELKFEVMGRKATLDEIEHEMLRKHYNEPRIHMALVCAARSCPPLRNEPYRGEKLERQFKEQTRRFLKDPSRFRIDRDAKKVHLSQIFNWFGSDFIKTYGNVEAFEGRKESLRAVLNFITPFLEAGDRDYLKQGRYEIAYLDYDWSLNEQN